MVNSVFSNLSHPRTLAWAFLVATCLLGLSGCASVPPPSAELDRASIALSSAQSSATENYAPVELRLAKDALASANALALAGDNELAKAWAERCEVYSELAVIKASAGSARAEVALQNEAIMQLKRELDAGNAPVDSLELPPTTPPGEGP
jgi:Domain of unknown function (DUF4398)